MQQFDNQVRKIITDPNFQGDPEEESAKMYCAAIMSNIFNQDFDTVYGNIDNYLEEWTGLKPNKTGIKAFIDGFRVMYYSGKLNELGEELEAIKSGNAIRSSSELGRHRQAADALVRGRTGKVKTEEEILAEIYEIQSLIDKYKDTVPLPWKEGYDGSGLIDALGRMLRVGTTSLAENSINILEGMALAAVGGGFASNAAKAIGLGSKGATIATAIGGRIGIYSSTYKNTRGSKYIEYAVNAGMPHDIAKQFSNFDAHTEAAIEALLGGLEAGGGRLITSAFSQTAVATARNATQKMFLSGWAGVALKGLLGAIREGGEEFSEELLQSLQSGGWYNLAVDEVYKRREELLKKNTEEEFGGLWDDIKEELEKLPDIEKKNWDEIWEEGLDAGITAFLSSFILGGAMEGIAYWGNVRSALQLADMAKHAPNEAAFREMAEAAERNGWNNPIPDDLKADEKDSLYRFIYETQQERKTPEEREADRKAREDMEEYMQKPKENPPAPAPGTPYYRSR